MIATMKMLALDVDAVRREFPSLELDSGGRPAVFLDGPGGTQVPERVIEAVSDYYRTANANEGGPFATSVRSDEIAARSRGAVADFYGAASPHEIKFGYNMTTLTFHVSRSIAATCAPGDEILVTALDHEANVAPWLAAAADRGLTARMVDLRADDCTLDMDDLDAKLSPRTKLVAVGYASNAVGTVNPVAEIAARAHAVGALVYVDAVHYAPHFTLSVATSGADLLVSSAYKWFGPHLGALWGRGDILESLPKYKVRPAHDDFETGTPALELIAGIGAAVDYLGSIGRRYGERSTDESLRTALVEAMRLIRDHELDLLRRLMAGLAAIPGIRMWGITDAARFETERAPTVSLTVKRVSAAEAATRLAHLGIFAWHGDFYARNLVERLGLADQGGLLRLGIVHYNTAAEIDRTLEAIEAISES
jgi:cysteine desulfurase family protein (TIGR01976 family)